VLDAHNAEMRVLGGGGQNCAIGGWCSYVKALGAGVGGVHGGTAAKDDTVSVHSGFDAFKSGTET
jgi:hypothetical protein